MAEKKPNPALDKFEFVGEYKSGICGDCGMQYNVHTINEATIKAMIAHGSKLFKPKEEKPAETYTGSAWNLEALKAEALKRPNIDTTNFTKKSDYQEALIADDKANAQ